jgi:hypothetical protein
VRAPERSRTSARGGRLGIPAEGRLTYRFADHEEVFEAGDAFYLPPGHIPLAEAGSELVQFSPSAELAAVSEVIVKNARRLQGMHEVAS